MELTNEFDKSTNEKDLPVTKEPLFMSTSEEKRILTFGEAMQEAIRQEMHRDEKVFMLGESIQGGSYPHTENLVKEFGEQRVIDTPLAEAGIHGMAYGAALEGYRPIIDFMSSVFSYYAFADIAVIAGQQYFMHGSRTPVPMVMIGAYGTGAQMGNDHSMSVHGTYLHHPGTKIVIPSSPYEAKGLLKAAIRDDNPVFFEWSNVMMMDREWVPEDDYTIALGVAAVKRNGSDITVVASGITVKAALEAAESLAADISVEVLDARTLEPFDMDGLLQSLAKTNRLVIVDEAYESGGFASTLSARVMEQGFDLLDAPVTRVTLPNMPIPGGMLEEMIMITPATIEAAIRKTCACDPIGA